MIALYARQSVERENSVSIETQLQYCRAALRPPEHAQPTETYIDEGCSGGNINRPAFQKLMRDIENGRVCKVVVYKLDRISRSLVDFVGILQTFKAHSVEFISSQEAFDTSSVYGDLILKILIVFAEFERTSIIGRVRDAYDKRTDLGIYMGGRRQYGFHLEDTLVGGLKTKKYAPNPEELAHIRFLFEQYACENTTLRSVQTALLAQHMRPLDGADWTTAKLSALLRNPVYVRADSAVYDYFAQKHVRIVGDLSSFDGQHAVLLYGRTTHDDTLPDWSDMKLVPAQHEGVISSDLWLACQRRLARNRQVGSSLSNQTSWLAGKLVCTQCGHALTTIKSRRADGTVRRYFQCIGRSHKKTCPGISCTLYADDLEDLISDCMLQKLVQLGTVLPPKTDTQASARNELTLRMRAVEQRQSKLSLSLLDGEWNASLLRLANEQAAELEREREALAHKLSALTQSESTAAGLDLADCWRAASFAQKKAAAAVLLRCVLLSPDGAPELVWTL